jgi:hypothetical protein
MCQCGGVESTAEKNNWQQRQLQYFLITSQCVLLYLLSTAEKSASDSCCSRIS